MIRIFFFLTGFALMVIGFTFTILYLNLLTIGYNFSVYVNFITRRIECYYTIIGFTIILLTITIKGAKKYELHI
jgi:hypothetical protein